MRRTRASTFTARYRRLDPIVGESLTRPALTGHLVPRRARKRRAGFPSPARGESGPRPGVGCGGQPHMAWRSSDGRHTRTASSSGLSSVSAPDGETAAAPAEPRPWRQPAAVADPRDKPEPDGWPTYVGLRQNLPEDDGVGVCLAPRLLCDGPGWG